MVVSAFLKETGGHTAAIFLLEIYEKVGYLELSLFVFCNSNGGRWMSDERSMTRRLDAEEK